MPSLTYHPSSDHRTLKSRKRRDYALIEAIQRGDRKAEEALLRHYWNFVLKIVMSMPVSKTQEDIETLFLEGQLGLLHAARKFNLNRGLMFSTYATYWVHRNIKRLSQEESGLIRFPAYVHEERREVITSISVGSLDEPIREDFTRLDRMVSTGVDPETASLHLWQKETIQEALSDLPQKTSIAITLRFGLDGRGERTLDEVGQILNVTRERVRQIVKRGLQKLECHRGLLQALSEQ